MRSRSWKAWPMPAARASSSSAPPGSPWCRRARDVGISRNPSTASGRGISATSRCPRANHPPARSPSPKCMRWIAIQPAQRAAPARSPTTRYSSWARVSDANPAAALPVRISAVARRSRSAAGSPPDRSASRSVRKASVQRCSRKAARPRSRPPSKPPSSPVSADTWPPSGYPPSRPPAVVRWPRTVPKRHRTPGTRARQAVSPWPGQGRSSARRVRMVSASAAVLSSR